MRYHCDQFDLQAKEINLQVFNWSIWTDSTMYPALSLRNSINNIEKWAFSILIQFERCDLL